MPDKLPCGNPAPATAVESRECARAGTRDLVQSIVSIVMDCFYTEDYPREERDKRLAAIIAQARRDGATAELKQLGKWVRDANGYNRDDAIDELARAIENRIRTLEAAVTDKLRA